MRATLVAAMCAAALAANADGIDFNAGADVRVRQEIMSDVPGLPGGGRLMPAVKLDHKNHVRFRARAWAQAAYDAGDSGKWRLYTRLTDELRWYVRPTKGPYTWPDEVVLDNLFIEGKGAFGGFLDLCIGRQDLYKLYGLDHLFVDGTPGDGSRTVFTDMARARLNFTEESHLDVFFLYNKDDGVLRWGTHRGNHRSLSGLGGGAEPDMDDWGYGAIWSSKLAEALPYKLFAMQKRTESYMQGGRKHPTTRRSLLGTKLEPQLTDELSLQFEGMGQIGRNGEDDWLTGWSAYAGVNWSEKGEGVKPFAKLGLHLMSGDKDAAREDGGNHAWDPMWARGVNDSEMFLYGSHYGAAWWSNMIYLKSTVGADIGRRHRLEASTGPIFAECEDGLGGGNGNFKGLLSQVRYDIPLFSAGERFEIFGHVLAELFNPGDYYETDRPGWFLRWQIDVKF